MKKLNSSFKKTLLASLVVPFAFGAASVSAGVLIEEWSYSVDSSFTAFTQTGGSGGAVEGINSNTLSWGVPAVSGGDQSSLTIQDVPAPGASPLVTDGVYVDGGQFAHNNNVLLASGITLTSFDLTSVLTLTPTNPAGAPLAPRSTTFESFFVETSNVSNCGFPSESECDDIFTIGQVTGADLNEFGNYEFSSSFDEDGYTYTVFLQLVDLDELDELTCEAAGIEGVCVGLQTQENGETTFNTQFRITATEIPVPEPGTLALLGLGIAGLSLSRRKLAARS